ncbi:MAG TPA: SpoIIE family protein phosphatase [Albitalea sp.]|uniref:PP2C family protein-serine/threonine phosphatase n=1 Tax=Piscinibacter sp. TaxID=1903157 RepID=UPI002ED63F06
MSLITPLEPGTPRRAPVQPDVHEALHSTAFARIASAVASSCGGVHRVNEDAHSPLGRSTLFVVADGVGGGAMAAMASRTLVAHLHDTLDGARVTGDAVGQALLDADRAIAERIAELTEAPGAATVALCAPVNVFASRWLLAWVGDCRIYRLRAGRDEPIAALTQDDTFARLDETPPAGSTPDDPARMVGNGAVAQANVAFASLACNDVLAVCSDGVHKHLQASDWRRLLEGPGSLAQRCESLVAQARANASTDDATVLLVQRQDLSAAAPRWIARLADGRGDTP